jgi:PAS domain S-box-containing protein
MQMNRKLQKSKIWAHYQPPTIEQIHAAVISTDRAGHIASWNQGAERLWEYSANEVQGKHISFLFPQERQFFWQYAVLRVLYQRGYHELELRLQKKSGGKFYAHLTLSLLKGGDGTVTGIIGHVVDITARKKVEEALKETARCQDKALAPLAYEIRNLLVPIRSAVQLLQLHTQPEQPYLQQVCALIERPLDRLMRLADNLLDRAQISCGQITLLKNRVDLVHCTLQAIKTVRPFLDERGHNLTLHLSPAPLPVEADPERLAQIIENLLQNAAKYTREGGQIMLTVEQAKTEAVLKIQDNGIGIPAELLPGLFDRRNFPERPLNRPRDGPGFGLSLAKDLVEMHGGRILADSPGPDQGSIFMVYLPLADTAPQFPVPRGNTERSFPCRRVLIVDDNRHLAHSFETLFNLWGHQVQTAPDGLTALELAYTFQPEVVLLDINLPDMDGYEVARRLRAEYGQRLKLIALTGQSQAQNQQRAKKTGFDHYLLKPPPMQTLKELIDSATFPPSP